MAKLKLNGTFYLFKQEPENQRILEKLDRALHLQDDVSNFQIPSSSGDVNLFIDTSVQKRPSKPSLSCTLIEEAISISQDDLHKGDEDALYTLQEETKEGETIYMKDSGDDVFETQQNQDVADQVILPFYKILSLRENVLQLCKNLNVDISILKIESRYDPFTRHQ